MKKLKIAFGCLSLFFVGNISAQPLAPANPDVATPVILSLPVDGFIEFGVINIAQENADAEVVGAKAGDTLRYEVKITTTSSNLVDFQAVVDISDILIATDIIDAGLGEVVDNDLVFQTFSQTAPCEKVFSFFVKVKKDCGKMETIFADAHGATTSVEINCDLPATGAGDQMVLWIAFFVGLITIFGIRKIRV